MKAVYDGCVIIIRKQPKAAGVLMSIDALDKFGVYWTAKELGVVGKPRKRKVFATEELALQAAKDAINSGLGKKGLR